MTERTPAPKRWRDGSVREARAAELLARAAPPQFTEQRLEGVLERVQAKVGAPRRARVVLRLRLLVAGIIVATAGAVAAAIVVNNGGRRANGGFTAKPPEAPAQIQSRPSTDEAADPVAEGEAAETPAVAVHNRSAKRAPKRPEKKVAVAPRAPSAPAVPAPVDDRAVREAALLRSAITQLRGGDAAAALASLDALAADFPSGLLQRERLGVRIDALLALHRQSEALALLEKATPSQLPRSLEMQVVRGELRAAAERCKDAEADFAAVLSAGAAALVRERALYGRAVCQAQSGTREAARRAFASYLEAFPTGKFARAARQFLDGR